MIGHLSGQIEAVLHTWDYPLCHARDISLKAIIIIRNYLLTKLVRSRWLDIDLILFCEFKHSKKELGQYPAILTSHLLNRELKQRRFRATGVNRKFIFLLLARFHARPMSYKALILAFTT